ncbi:MAG: hypothetical protein PVH63_06215 [Balneolaceae bacterium]
MKLFRLQPDDSPPSLWKMAFLAILVLLVVGSFILQISLGVCPVP